MSISFYVNLMLICQSHADMTTSCWYVNLMLICQPQKYITVYKWQPNMEGEKEQEQRTNV